MLLLVLFYSRRIAEPVAASSCRTAEPSKPVPVSETERLLRMPDTKAKRSIGFGKRTDRPENIRMTSTGWKTWSTTKQKVPIPGKTEKSYRWHTSDVQNLKPDISADQCRDCSGINCKRITRGRKRQKRSRHSTIFQSLKRQPLPARVQDLGDYSSSMDVSRT